MSQAEPQVKRPLIGQRGLLVGIATATLAMVVLQLGASLSKPAMEAHGAFEITWLRLMWATVLLLVFVRPKVLIYSSRQWIVLLSLGVAMALLNICYYQSILYLPLGVATSIQFTGPLSVAAFYLVRVNRRQIIWPACAAIGVLLLATAQSPGGRFLRDWMEADALGVAWALGAAFGWGCYVVLMKRAGNLFSGLEGLAMSLAAATALSAPFALLASDEGISVAAIGAAFGLAILVPLVPYTLEMLALRRMETRAFGMLMSMEPVISVIIGWFILSQSLTIVQLISIALITLAMLRVVQSRPAGA